MTNGDKIRSMTDEELQKWLCDLIPGTFCCLKCPGYFQCVDIGSGMEYWLKQEVLHNAD